MPLPLLPLALASPILVWIAWTDFSRMRIRNAAVVAALAVFLLTVPAIGLGEAFLRLLAASAVFVAGFAMFAARMVGGGDVKMGAALLLFIPTGTYALFAVLFSGAMLLGLAVMLSLRAIPPIRRAGPVSLRARGTFPMGLALGLSGVAHLGVLAMLA